MSVDLDDSQRKAVDIKPEARQIIVAGPGSGKTEVVSALVEHLVEDEGLEPADELLVISFSNAAVHAVSARLAAKGIDPVTVQTMDSLAAEILRDLSDEEHTERSFDQRIVAATDLLRQESWDEVENLMHLVVDEVQDVVGVRADFLLELIQGLDDNAGFTLLGDPAQGIYDFQLNELSETRPTTSWPRRLRPVTSRRST